MALYCPEHNENRNQQTYVVKIFSQAKLIEFVKKTGFDEPNVRSTYFDIGSNYRVSDDITSKDVLDLNQPDFLVDILEKELQYSSATEDLLSSINLIRKYDGLFDSMHQDMRLPMHQLNPFAPFIKITIVKVNPTHQRDLEIEWEMETFSRLYLLDHVFRRLGVRLIVNEYCEHHTDSQSLTESITAIELDHRCGTTNVRYVILPEVRLQDLQQSIIDFLKERKFQELGTHQLTYVESDFNLLAGLTFFKRVVFGTILSDKLTLFEGSAENLKDQVRPTLNDIHWHPTLYKAIKFQTLRYWNFLKPPTQYHLHWNEDFPICGDGLLQVILGILNNISVFQSNDFF